MLAPFFSRPRQRRFTSGGSGLPVVIILAALAISAAVFFLYSRKHIKPRQAAPVPSVTESASVPPPPPGKPTASIKPTQSATSSKPATSPAPAGTKTPTVPMDRAPAAPASGFGFARPLDVGKDLLRSLAAGEFAAAGKLAAAADPTQADSAAAVFQKMMQELGVKAGRADQVELVGIVENLTRVAVPLLVPGSDQPVRVQLDLERDERMGWKIVRLKLPKELAASLAALPQPAPTTGTATASAPSAPAAGQAAATTSSVPGAKPTAPSAAPMTPPGATAKVPPPPAKSLFVVDESPDALSFGHEFVRALLKHDFVAAKRLVDEKRVPAERLAGLCIVFEEGRYELKPNKPLIITVANPEVSWVIAQVQSETLQQSTEFGLELQRSGIDQPWRVVGLNLSEILGSFAASAAKLGVPYTPIVTNPKGGESLALYFEYDHAELHPRALKQLEIVAGLLKSDTNRKLNIAGHTDAMGTDEYNIRLSQGRAESVKKRLVELGVSAEQVVTTGLGKAQPLGPNQKADGTDNPEGRSKNRRAEIFLDF